MEGVANPSGGGGSANAAYGIYAKDSTVTVRGNVQAVANNANACAIYAEGSGTIWVGGNAITDGNGTYKPPITIETSSTASVYVEGEIQNANTMPFLGPSSKLYIGEIDMTGRTACFSGFLVGLEDTGMDITEYFDPDTNIITTIPADQNPASGRAYFAASVSFEGRSTLTARLKLKKAGKAIRSLTASNANVQIKISPDGQSAELTYPQTGGMSKLRLALKDAEPTSPPKTGD